VSDRLNAIRARLIAATPGPWINDVEWDEVDAVVIPGIKYLDPYRMGVARVGNPTNADLIANAPADIAWLLERESQAMGALGMLSVLALTCCDAAIGRASLDEGLRDFGFTLDEVERLEAERDAWKLEAQGCACSARRVADCKCLDESGATAR
jgi:hypothetical protein